MALRSQRTSNRRMRESILAVEALERRDVLSATLGSLLVVNNTPSLRIANDCSASSVETTAPVWGRAPAIQVEGFPTSEERMPVSNLPSGTIQRADRVVPLVAGRDEFVGPMLPAFAADAPNTAAPALGGRFRPPVLVSLSGKPQDQPPAGPSTISTRVEPPVKEVSAPVNVKPAGLTTGRELGGDRPTKRKCVDEAAPRSAAFAAHDAALADSVCTTARGKSSAGKSVAPLSAPAMGLVSLAANGPLVSLL